MRIAIRKPPTPVRVEIYLRLPVFEKNENH